MPVSDISIAERRPPHTDTTQKMKRGVADKESTPALHINGEDSFGSTAEILRWSGSVSLTSESRLSASSLNRSLSANCGCQRAAQQQEIIALHLRRQSRTPPKMLDRRSAGWRHRSCTPALRIRSLIGRTSSSAPFRFSSVDNRHADEAQAQACRRRRVFKRRPFWAKACNPLTPG